MEDEPKEQYFATKYASPRDEVLGAMQDNGWANESSGNVEAPTGFFSRISNDDRDMPEIADAFEDEIAEAERYEGFSRERLLGHFLLVTENVGFVTVTEFDTEPEVKAVYDQLEEEYNEWENPDPLRTVELHGLPIRAWIKWLSKDEGRVPASRYGRDSEECSYWAVACEAIYVEANGDDHESAEALRFYQGLVVNDSDSVLEFVRSYWYAVPEPLKEYLDYEDNDLNMHQQAALAALCMRYEVEYNADHYLPRFDLPRGWVAGFIGGVAIQAEHPTIYCGVSPEGEISS